MEDTIFSRLFRYHTTEKRTPQEDYLTELLAWMIDSLPQFGQDYVTFLCNNSKVKIQHNEKCAVNAETQVVVSKGRIDMVITVGSDLCFVCEHKVDSILENNQITKYQSCEAEIIKRYDVETVHYVFLSKIEDKLEKEQQPDIIVRWHEIYNYFREKKYENNSFESIMVQQFLNYLTEVGMGIKNNIQIGSVENFCGAMKLLPTLKSIFDELSSVDWEKEKECDGIKAFAVDSKYHPHSVHDKSWGRIGISFFDFWEPNIFAGVVYDNDDHKLNNFCDQPQFVVLIDCKDPKFTEQYKKQNSKWLNSITTKNEFIIENNPESNWRAIILKKPLKKVLENSESYEAQKETIKTEIRNGINCILECYKESK